MVGRTVGGGGGKGCAEGSGRLAAVRSRARAGAGACGVVRGGRGPDRREAGEPDDLVVKQRSKDQHREPQHLLSPARRLVGRCAVRASQRSQQAKQPKPHSMAEGFGRRRACSASNACHWAASDQAQMTIVRTESSTLPAAAARARRQRPEGRRQRGGGRRGSFLESSRCASHLSAGGSGGLTCGAWRSWTA